MSIAPIPNTKVSSMITPDSERDPVPEYLTTNQGLQISDNHNSLKAGARGPTVLEDFVLREKITHFDHERIPERAVHARGTGAHGFFEVYQPLTELTCAGFLSDPSIQTPVFVRFSTVAGSRGSADTVRDARGFAVKFYTPEENYDLVGNNMPVFFIQDAIKFPDLIHAVKPEPHTEMPQAASAHDTFWDFVSLMPESTHMLMWIMSDRAIPRSLRMMEGFGVHTFRFINALGISHFVKFHWKPKLGTHALIWDEAQKIAGKDSDFHRRDLWDAIAQGQFPEWELGVQVVPEADECRFDFDLLDATKLIPEELVPVCLIGRMVLNRNPDNLFTETEQVAFHPGHLVPGIDFSNDPLLQGRLCGAWRGLCAAAQTHSSVVTTMKSLPWPGTLHFTVCCSSPLFGDIHHDTEKPFVCNAARFGTGFALGCLRRHDLPGKGHRYRCGCRRYRWRSDGRRRAGHACGRGGGRRYRPRSG